jgi:hypothetical protein
VRTGLDIRVSDRNRGESQARKDNRHGDSTSTMEGAIRWVRESEREKSVRAVKGCQTTACLCR